MRALLLAAAMMAAVLAFAIPVNLALGRVIHWDVVTGLGLIGLAAFTLMNRWQKGFARRGPAILLRM